MFADLKNPPGQLEEIIPERKDANLTGVAVSKNRIAVTYPQERQQLDRDLRSRGQTDGLLKLPGIGSAGIATDEDRDEAYLSFSSYNYPIVDFPRDLTRPDAAGAGTPAVPVDLSTVEVKQDWFSLARNASHVHVTKGPEARRQQSDDSLRIWRVHAVDDAGLQPPTSSGLTQGRLRGRQIYGGGGSAPRGTRPGSRARSRTRTLPGRREYLINSGYTNPKKLAVMGGSQGGPFVGSFARSGRIAPLRLVPLNDMPATRTS